MPLRIAAIKPLSCAGNLANRMFSVLGHFVCKWWAALLGAWVVTLVALSVTAPKLEDVVQTGEFAFLPAGSPSLVSEQLLREAFPQNRVGSSLVILATRNDGEPLTETDLDLLEPESNAESAASTGHLRDVLVEIATRFGPFQDGEADESAETAAETPEAGAGTGLKNGTPHRADSHAGEEPGMVSAIRSPRDKSVGKLLRSADQRAALMLLDLRREFMDIHNVPLVAAVESAISSGPIAERAKAAGIHLQMTGTALVGRDMLVAAADSAKRTEALTIGLVVLLLILLYRAPLLAIIPLLSVFVAVKTTMTLLTTLASLGWVVLFQGIETYVTVLLYGAGVDYCLFLIARQKEELDHGCSIPESIWRSISMVGAAITASAGTVICGIGMMVFAEFGKFRDAGIAISLGLVIVLLASLTFTPTLLLMTGRWAFWRPGYGIDFSSHLDQPAPWWSLRHLWDWISHKVEHRPAFVLVTSCLVMLPAAIFAVFNYSYLSYGLLSDLPANRPSVVGTAAFQQHFPAGAMGPVTVVLRNPQLDFSSRTGDDAGWDLVREFRDVIWARRVDLGLADVRSVSHPLGGESDLDELARGLERKIALRRAKEHYISQADLHRNHVVRLELTTQQDPFSRTSLDHLNFLEIELHRMLPESLRGGTQVSLVGATVSIRDLKHVTDRDQVRIDLLVITGVYLILVVLLRRPAVSLYLILSVLFSYLVTLGVTIAVFWAMNPSGFAGLDWKVPLFLFTILIAVGEDYNIFLMTRIEEEQQQYGPIGGVIHALSRTGQIISSCGIIMAGTFASLMAGTLMGMTQLGFALAFGVLLDTFVVRTILVPAYLVLVYSGRLGALGKVLGGVTAPPSKFLSVPTPP